MTMQENTESKWCVGLYVDSYKSYYDFKPTQKEVDHFLSLSEEEKDIEMAFYGCKTISVKEMDEALAHGQLWDACHLVAEKIEDNLDLLSDELFEAILRAKARKEEAEQAWLDTRL